MPNYAMKSKGENINHFNAIRFRIVGEGPLYLTLNSLDNVENQDLVPLTYTESMNREPLVLANFKQQRVRLHGYTDTLGGFYKITRIILFAKPVATGFPG